MTVAGTRYNEPMTSDDTIYVRWMHRGAKAAEAMRFRSLREFNDHLVYLDERLGEDAPVEWFTLGESGPGSRTRLTAGDLEECYAGLADELNDADLTWADGERPTLDDFDPDFVRRAGLFSDLANMPWPPRVGDFDRYCEWVHSGRRTYPLD